MDAVDILKQLGRIDQKRVLQFLNHDFTKVDISDATAIYMCSTCYSQELMAQLAEKFSKLKKGLHDILNGCEWKCTYTDGSCIDYQALCSFTWHTDGLNCRLDVCSDGYVYYDESSPDPNRPGEYAGYFSCNFKPASLRTGIKVAAEFKELTDGLRTGQ